MHRISILHFFAFLFPALQGVSLPIHFQPNAEPSTAVHPRPRFTRIHHPRASSTTLRIYSTPLASTDTMRSSSAARENRDQDVPSLNTIIVIIILAMTGLCLSVIALVACGHKLCTWLSGYISRLRARKGDLLAAVRVGESAGEPGPCGMQLDMERGDMESAREIDREMSTPGSRSATGEAETVGPNSTGSVIALGERGTVRRVKAANRDSVRQL